MDETRNEAPREGEAESAQRAPYRNLRVWIESFDLALDIFQMTRRLDGADGRSLTRSLIEASSRMPVAVARGQSSGSATEFVRCLHEGLSELSELETHLLMCGELGYLTTEQVGDYERRILEIRRMTGGLIRRLRLSSHGSGERRPEHSAIAVTRIAPDGAILPRRPGRRGERGSALLIALLVSAALGIIGTVYLQIASAEERIARHGRDRDQLLNVAETGARVVKSWFDRPVSGDPSNVSTVRHAFLDRFDPRNPAHFDRTRRLIEDGNPVTAPVPADGSPGREWYRQGREVAPGLPHLDLFQKPYRRGTILSFVGTEDGPDIVLEDRPGTIDFIDEINAALFPKQEITGRIERIEIYAPPAAAAGPSSPRLGVATVKVTSVKHGVLDRTGPVPVVAPGSRPAGRGVVRMALAEIPTNAPQGALESCGDIFAPGRLRTRWGRVQAVGNITLVDQMDRLDSFVDSAFPYASFGRRISGASAGGDLADWLTDPDDSIEDPWLKVAAGGDLIGWQSYPDQPLPYRQTSGIDYDHSNLFQRVPGMRCPVFDYALWKSIALSTMPGDRYVHYYSYDAPSGRFRERGAGPARSVRDWTHGRSGIFFFDTVDGAPPGAGNLTPAVTISGGDWSTAGVIFLNAVSFRATSIRGVERVLLPPGEPFDDVDHDLVADPAETFVNLRYATAIGSGTTADDMLKQSVATQTGAATSPDGEAYTGATTLQRDSKGPPLLASVNLFGVLYNSGDVVAEGDAVIYGSLVAGRTVTQVSPGAATPWIYFDERLNTGEWPPPEIAMPRTFITLWQTSRP